MRANDPSLVFSAQVSAIIRILLNGVICFGLGALLTKTRSIPLKVAAFCAVPFVLAYVLYWALAFLESSGSPSSEYANWQGLFIGPFALAGYIAMVVGFALFRWVLRRRMDRTA